MSEDKKQKFHYVKKEGAIGLGLFNKDKGAGLGKLGNQGADQAQGLGNLKAQFQEQIDSFGNRLEQRAVKIRTRFQNIGGFGNGEIQPQKEIAKEVFYCPECNAEVQETQKFCAACSAGLTVQAKREKEHREKLRISSHMSVLCDS